MAVPLEPREALTLEMVTSTLEEVRSGGKVSRPAPKARRR